MSISRFRRWSSPLCCPGWITVMLRWLAYEPTYLIVSSLCSTLLLRRLLDCDDQTTSLTLASFHWLRAPERIKFKLAAIVYRGIHGTAPRYLSDYHLLHRVSDITSRRRLRSSTSSELVIPLSRLVTVGDRPFAVADPRLWNTLPEDITSASSLLVFRRKLKTHLFRQSYPDIVL